ncbi:FAD:protein FMN transferase [Celerinatantimonas sp. YJH-8]|uniref:FAD:protein FMN transferase n=1 Tax=Celerinatantimonas sp. YJH-8 TaxID=3228714 RepID=UPI0038C76F1E
MSIQLKQWLAFLGLAFLLLGCQKHEDLYTLTLKGGTMGTFYQIKVVAPKDKLPDGQTLQALVDKELEQVNDEMSTYRPQSELSLFNSQQTTQVVPISDHLRTVVTEALRISGLTGGAFDITVGPLVNLWGFGPTGRPDKVPSPEKLSAAEKEIGYHHLHLSTEGWQKDIPGLYVDLSGIAKGYGVDRVADLLKAQGFHNFLVNVGGELRQQGHNDQNEPWRVAVEKPRYNGSQAVERIVTPGDRAIATSGDYRNYFEENGIRYSHEIDPKTGHPIQNRVVSASVIADNCMTADGFATAFMVMGRKASIDFATAHKMAVMIIEKTDEGYAEFYTPEFKQYLVKKAAS